jgi:hypothetical protein
MVAETTSVGKRLLIILAVCCSINLVSAICDILKRAEFHERYEQALQSMGFLTSARRSCMSSAVVISSTGPRSRVSRFGCGRKVWRRSPGLLNYVLL